MSYNGSGTFQINTSGQPVIAGTVISSTAFNALTADLATGLSTAITKDGQTTTTVRIPFAAGISSTLSTDATSTGTGSIITSGGIGITKALWVGGLANFSSTITYGGVTLTAAVTGTGKMVLDTSPTISGLTSSLPIIDNIKMGYTTTATAAGTTTLTVASNYRQFFTGSTTQTIVLPVTSTLVIGIAYEIENNSTGTLTVNSSGGNLVGTIPAGVCAHAVCIGTTLTTAADWDWHYISTSAITGTGANVLATSPTITTPTIDTITSAAATALTLKSAGTTALTISTSQNTTLAGTLTTSSRGIAKASMPAGTVLQVVSTTKTDTFSTTSLTFVDITSLSVSITPTSTSSKILIVVNTNYSPSGTSTLAVFNLVRDSTNISQPATAPTYTGSFFAYTNAADTMLTPSFNFLDSPATTSSTTYKIQTRTNSGTMYVNRRLSVDTASTSTITVMEIAA